MRAAANSSAGRHPAVACDAPQRCRIGCSRRRHIDSCAATAANKSDDDAKIKAIAGPALLGTLADPLLSVVDTAWVSRLGTTALEQWQLVQKYSHWS